MDKTERIYMGYYVRALNEKRTLPNWKVQFITQKKEFTKTSLAKIPRKEWDIPKARWGSIGFYPNMRAEEARSRAKQLNTQLELKRQEERRQHLEWQIQQLELKAAAVMPELFKDEFESKYIYTRLSDQESQKRFLTAWRATQRMLIELSIEPMDWHYEAFQFYDYFHKKQFSLSYVKKILLVTNLWGAFLTRKLGQPFTRIPLPRGKEKSRILDAYFAKTGRPYNQSDPLTPEQLKKAKNDLRSEYFNWLYLSVWFGLRPQEVDNLKVKGHARVQKGTNDILVLWVYQTKLASVPHRYRWKLIPIIFPEQKKALRILRKGNFQRPLVKVVRRTFGKHTTLYGGRKGFTDLMLRHNQELTHISQWMGHSSIERTWRNYKSRRITHHSMLNHLDMKKKDSWNPFLWLTKTFSGAP